MGEYKYLIYCQISQRLNAISLAHISLELIFEYFEAFSVLFRRSKFGDIEGRAVGHVNDEGVGQHHKLISPRVQFHHVRHFIPSMLYKNVEMMLNHFFQSLPNFEDLTSPCAKLSSIENLHTSQKFGIMKEPKQI